MSGQFVFTPETRDIVLARVTRFCESIKDGRAYEVVVKQFRKTRSSLQNRALWGVAYKLLSEHTGYRANEIHEYACGQFYGWTETEVFGKRKQRPVRTTTTNEDGDRDVISTTECMEFYAFLQELGAGAGVYIPDPDPDWKEKEAA